MRQAQDRVAPGDAGIKPAGGRRGTEEGEGSLARVLIVEDEGLLRELLLQALQEQGYDCVGAGQGAEAIEILQRGEFDLVISDIMMPGLSGVDLLKTIKEEWPDTAVIMATGVMDVHTVVEAIRSGAYDYVTKPFQLDDVLMTIERALDAQHMRRELREYQLNLEQKVEEQADELRTLFMRSMQALAQTLEAKDPYTGGHSERVAALAANMLEAIGVKGKPLERLRLAGTVHDIGKVGVREAVLNKPGKLTEEEYAHVMTHTTTGEKILSIITTESDIVDAVKHHHERYDGKGLPSGLAGEAIPLFARILAVADAYDAMTSNRPYRDHLPEATARNELEKSSGIQFDPKVVTAFLNCLEGADKKPQ
jgi:putative nucleotidyltransferase with HDIG domain